MTNITRRNFLQRATASGLGLSLQFGNAAKAIANENYRSFEDLYRTKWTWDSVVRGTHGTNCAGTCAFNVFVKNGVVWREEQQGQYEQLGDVPDFGPRGCQKGMRHHKYMYGDQRKVRGISESLGVPTSVFIRESVNKQINSFTQ